MLPTRHSVTVHAPDRSHVGHGASVAEVLLLLPAWTLAQAAVAAFHAAYGLDPAVWQPPALRSRERLGERNRARAASNKQGIPPTPQRAYQLEQSQDASSSTNVGEAQRHLTGPRGQHRQQCTAGVVCRQVGVHHSSLRSTSGSHAQWSSCHAHYSHTNARTHTYLSTRASHPAKRLSKQGLHTLDLGKGNRLLHTQPRLLLQQVYSNSCVATITMPRLRHSSWIRCRLSNGVAVQRRLDDSANGHNRGTNL